MFSALLGELLSTLFGELVPFCDWPLLQSEGVSPMLGLSSLGGVLTLGVVCALGCCCGEFAIGVVCGELALFSLFGCALFSLFSCCGVEGDSLFASSTGT